MSSLYHDEIEEVVKKVTEIAEKAFDKEYAVQNNIKENENGTE